MDRQRDRHKHRQGNSSIPPLTVLWGVKKRKKSGQENSMLLWGGIKTAEKATQMLRFLLRRDTDGWNPARPVSILVMLLKDYVQTAGQEREEQEREINPQFTHRDH